MHRMDRAWDCARRTRPQLARAFRGLWSAKRLSFLCLPEVSHVAISKVVRAQGDGGKNEQSLVKKNRASKQW